MSLSVFQSTMLRLIAEPAFRERVIAGGDAALAGLALTAQERRRLAAIAVDRGLDINRLLHRNFRLGALRAMLPLTCRLLGPRRLAHALGGFWADRAPPGANPLPEALAFCTWLARRRPRVRYLDEVLAYERAVLQLEREGADPAPCQVLRFAHDPAALLGALVEGRAPRGIPARPCSAVGVRGGDGRVRWTIHPDEPAGWRPMPAQRPRTT